MASLPPLPRQSPPWSGPSFSPVEAKLAPKAGAHMLYPFEASQGTDKGMFPPVCIRSHWDPEQIIRRTLPSGPNLATPLEPRPWTKICLSYVTSQDFEDAPRPHDNMVMPSGGVNYPPSRFQEAVDKDSLLRRLDRPLGTCEQAQYMKPLQPASTVPDRPPPNHRFIDELSFPMACMRSGDYDCRAQVHEESWQRSNGFLFNNPTKQDKYKVLQASASSASSASSANAGKPSS